MSESLPYSGVANVAVSRCAVVTHACRDSPLRSSPIVLMDVATIVWSSAAMNMPSIRPPRIVRISRCVGAWNVEVGASGASVLCLVIGPSRDGAGTPLGWGARQQAEGYDSHELVAQDNHPAS